MKKILLLKSSRGLANNIECTLMYNLRQRGYQVTDYPYKARHYSNFDGDELRFGWPKINTPIDIDRSNIISRANNNEFETIILFDPLHTAQKELFKSLNLNLNVIIIDPYESPKIEKELLGYGPYYKREYYQRTKNVYPISFSLPKFLIPDISNLRKIKDFAKHNQVAGLSKLGLKTYNRKGHYAFDNQKDYYLDLQLSKYATTKRKNGWDCYRHYEIAFNGCIICFYKLDEKPMLCAPHGLIDMYNCVSFNSAQELEEKINLIQKNNVYKYIQTNSYHWALQNCSENLYNCII